MAQASDLPQYQTSPPPAQHTLQFAVADIERGRKCEHKCTVSKGDRHRLWAAIIVLAVASILYGVHIIVQSSPPARVDSSGFGSAHRHDQAGVVIPTTSITSLKSSFQSPSTISNKWAFSSSSTSSTLSATTLPVIGNMYQQLPMVGLTKRAPAPNPMVKAPSLSVNGRDTPTGTHISPYNSLFEDHRVFPVPDEPAFWITESFTMSPDPTVKQVAKAAATTMPLPANDKSAAKTPYVRQGDCATSSHARACLRQKFDCEDLGDGAGPVCMGRQSDKQRGGKKEPRAGKADHSRRDKLIGGIVGGLLGLLLLSTLLWALWRRKSHKNLRSGAAAARSDPVDPTAVPPSSYP